MGYLDLLHCMYNESASSTCKKVPYISLMGMMSRKLYKVHLKLCFSQPSARRTMLMEVESWDSQYVWCVLENRLLNVPSCLYCKVFFLQLRYCLLQQVYSQPKYFVIIIHTSGLQMNNWLSHDTLCSLTSLIIIIVVMLLKSSPGMWVNLVSIL